MRNTNRLAAVAFAAVVGAAALTAEDKKPAERPVTDAEFVIKAASGGVFEVESSKLAKSGAKGDDVKKFAEMMIADHDKANKELMGAARKADLGIPTKMLDHHQKLLDKVKAAKGEELDKIYMDTQVTAHVEAVELFANAAKNAKDPGVRAFAEKTLPTIKAHLEHARKHAKKGTDK